MSSPVSLYLFVTFQGGFNADCVTEPSRCSEGFTLAFWLKVNGTGYIMSSGSFTSHRNGPGYQLYYHESLKRFKFLLETRDSRWSLLLHEEVGLWTHMTFTWNNRDGLRYYEDGNLSTFTNRPESVSPLRRQNYTPVITLARPSNMRRLGEYGKFEISKFAIWLKELSTEEIAGVYRKSVEYNQENVLCCYFQSGWCKPLIGSLSNHDNYSDKNVTNLHRGAFQMTVKLLPPITTGTKSAMNQSQFLAITSN